MSIALSPILPHLSEVTTLYEQAFPSEERRPTEDWHALIYAPKSNAFHAEAILTNGEQLAGFITTWQFLKFTYVEHFAILPSQRGNGLGAEAIRQLSRRERGAGRCVVLEVEPRATSAAAARRIAFYERCGFTLSNHSYLQPPYRPTDAPLPLSLMSTDATYLADHFDQVRTAIHQTVYGLNEALVKE